MRLSIIIPSYNEATNIPLLYERLYQVLEKDFKDFEYEILWVDDGSSDDSFQVLKNLHQKNKKVKALQFSRNFGQHLAITAGLEQVTGDYIILMDGDLQDPPEAFIDLYRKLEEGYDLVYALRSNRQDSFFKKLFSNSFWKFIRYLSDLPIPENQAMLRIFNRKVLDTLNRFSEKERFYGGLFAWVGFKQIGIPITHGERATGASKYSWRGMFRLALTATLNFSDKPIKWILYKGISLTIIGFILSVINIILLLTKNDFSNVYLLIAILILMGGGILMALGIVGLYVHRIHQQSLNRPLYILQDQIR